MTEPTPCGHPVYDGTGTASWPCNLPRGHSGFHGVPGSIYGSIPSGVGSEPMTDRAGFQRRWGVHVFVSRGAPWLSFGLHLDWHTPTLDLYLGKAAVQIGRNNWQGEGRFVFAVQPTGPHTDQCVHERGRLWDPPNPSTGSSEKHGG